MEHPQSVLAHSDIKVNICKILSLLVFTPIIFQVDLQGLASTRMSPFWILLELRAGMGPRQFCRGRGREVEAEARQGSNVLNRGKTEAESSWFLPRSWLSLVFDILFMKLLCSVFH